LSILFYYGGCLYYGGSLSFHDLSAMTDTVMSTVLDFVSHDDDDDDNNKKA